MCVFVLKGALLAIGSKPQKHGGGMRQEQFVTLHANSTAI